MASNWSPSDPHGGGDLALLRTLHERVQDGSNVDVMTSRESSMTSHVLAFLADDSRLQGGLPGPMPASFDGARAGGPGDRRSVEQ